MHRYNNKYGYGQILRDYCGQGQDVPIWGEIQHALFLHTRYFRADGRLGPPREQLQRFPRLLSWQTLLPFPHQIPIGDPLLYAKRLGVSDTKLADGFPGPGDYGVLMPKLNDEVPLDERRKHYLTGAREAVEQSGTERLLIALHPREKSHRDFFEEALSDLAEVVWAEDGYLGGATAWSQALVAGSSRLFSDYFGAHVFRASWFFERPVSIVGDFPINPATNTTMVEYLRGFLDANDDMATQRSVAHAVLGVEYRREPGELADILGFTGWRKVAGRPIRVVYQRLRRARVARQRRR
jgi:hypothetical protein